MYCFWGGGNYWSRSSLIFFFLGNYSNVSICPVAFPHVIGRYLNDCNAIDNHKSMYQSDPSIDKYWVKQSGYFRLGTTVALVMGITYGKLLFCCCILEISWKSNFQWGNTMTGQFKNASKIVSSLLWYYSFESHSHYHWW